MVYLFDTTKWLHESVPPNSYKIRIGYILNDKRLHWIDLPERFPNYIMAQNYANYYFPKVARQISGSNRKPNKVFSPKLV